MNIPKKTRQIKQTIRGMGTRPAVIDAVDMLCDLIEELAHDVQISMLEVPEEVCLPTDVDPVLEPELPVEDDSGSESTDDIPTTEPESEKEKNTQDKEDSLKKIFSDNETGRYSGPINS